MKFPNLHIKKLDLFIIKSFLMLFVATFFICTFILIMQFLWRWVDEFVGKGLDLWVMAQFFYLGSLTMVGHALPLAILLAFLILYSLFGFITVFTIYPTIDKYMIAVAPNKKADTEGEI